MLLFAVLSLSSSDEILLSWSYSSCAVFFLSILAYFVATNVFFSRFFFCFCIFFLCRSILFEVFDEHDQNVAETEHDNEDAQHMFIKFALRRKRGFAVHTLK